MSILKSTHNAGFFSCCSIKLQDMVSFINLNKKIPDIIDSSQQFEWYKNKNDKDKDKDITYDYFEKYDNTESEITYPINYDNGHQFLDYSK